MKRSTKIVLSIAIALPVAYYSLIYYAFRPSKGVRFLFPEKYAGWVCVTYDAKDAPPLERQDGFMFVKVPKNGVVRTSSTGSYDENDYYIPTYNEYYYYSENGTRKVERGEIDFGGGFTSQMEGKKEITSYFWISTKGNGKSDYEKYVKGRDVLEVPPCGIWERKGNE